VLLRRSHVLLVRARRKRRWQLPGGGVKRRESPVEAARREVEEETGIEVRIVAFTGSYRRSDGSRAVVFAGLAPARCELVGPRYEIREQRWVPSAEALRLVSPRTRRRISDALAAFESRFARRVRARRHTPRLTG
jgi:8-oxo-dGTP diphosphatase